MLKITILYGAVRTGRLSIRAARAVEKALKETGKTEVTFIDIKTFGIPVMESRLFETKDPADTLQEISAALSTSDGIIFVSPEYNNSYSGAFKNTVDYFTKEWFHKPIGVVACSDGKQGGINASNLMQLLVLAIDGYAVPNKLLVPELPTSLDEQGNPQNEKLAKNIKKFVDDFLWFTEAIADRKMKG
jgi:azobenzene reductase